MGTTESNADQNIVASHYEGAILVGAGHIVLSAHLENLSVDTQFSLSPWQSRVFRAVALSQGVFGFDSPLSGKTEYLDIPALFELMALFFGVDWTDMADTLGQTHTAKLLAGWALQQRYPLLAAP